MIFIIFSICIPLVHSASHIFITTYTGVNGQMFEETPEFSAVTTLDGQQIDYYDSEIKKLIPKQDWMKDYASKDLWKADTEIRENVQQIYKNNIPRLMQRFNQTHGVHTYQRMYGCDWDDETGVSRGFDEYSYDGERFISLDLKENRYTASVPQAIPTVMKWNKDREQLVYLKRYYRYECVYWLKELLHFSKASSEKTVKVPESTGRSLTKPAVNDNKSDGSDSYIMPTVVIIILVILILSVLYALQNNWDQIKQCYKKRYYKDVKSDECNYKASIINKRRRGERADNQMKSRPAPCHILTFEHFPLLSSSEEE